MSRSAFQEELRAYEPANEIERAHRDAMLDLLAYSEDALSRQHFVPGHFTASCFIVDAQGRLLLHHHRRLDRWLQMGGHIEPDETPKKAALREGMEESGLPDLEIVGSIFDLDIHDIPASDGDPEHAHFDVRYLARTSSPERVAIAAAESHELAWFEIERAAGLMPGAESQRVVAKIERLLRERSLH